MRKGVGVAAIVLLAAALFAASGGALAQADRDDEDQESQQNEDSQILGTGGQPMSDSASLDPTRLLLFSTTDLWRHGGFTHSGLVWAPSEFDRSGPVLKLIFGGGVYRYLSGARGNTDVYGVELAGSILPGWRFVRDNLIVTVFLGYDFQNHRLLPDDPSAGLRGSYGGVRTGFELWYTPTAKTMLAADASASTVGPSYNARIAAGWRVFDAFYLGPEVQAFAADHNYRQLRAGLHLTGFRIGRYEWSIGTGWATDTDKRNGAYGKLGVFTLR